jgi:rhomboid protease GluP
LARCHDLNSVACGRICLEVGATLDMSVIFRGSRALCQEYSLVFEAQAIDHEMTQSEDLWVLSVDPAVRHRAYEELTRYSAERSAPRSITRFSEPFKGAAAGAAAYTSILLLAAYAAGRQLFDVDWFSVGALDAGLGRTQWWRALTALTLHVDPAHLFSNLFSGILVGAAVSRLLGPGVAWAAVLAAAACANYFEMWIAPASHRAIGASTAVFAALGLLTGLAWSERLKSTERQWYRWAPLIAGVCLLTLFGAGSEHVDVLGHLLGFVFGTLGGWLCVQAGMPGNRNRRPQIILGLAAVSSICLAWFLALHQA